MCEDGVTATVRGKISTRQTDKGIFLNIDALNLDLNVKKPRLSVAKIFNNNRILGELISAKWKKFCETENPLKLLHNKISHLLCYSWSYKLVP